jgi:hypothetical protein
MLSFSPRSQGVWINAMPAPIMPTMVRMMSTTFLDSFVTRGVAPGSGVHWRLSGSHQSRIAASTCAPEVFTDSPHNAN